MSGFVTVSMQQGTLRGRRRRTSAGTPFLSFHGIPYAKPPIGALRFKAPEPPESWTGIRDATKDGNRCMQFSPFTNSVVGDEDCLVLNVYTPRLPTGRKEDKPLPVLVWIHGGGFIAGSGSDQDLQQFMDYEVVVVSINYRLGALGFLSVGTLEAPGNAGLKDQTMALRWVKEKVAAFGGDPNNVTIIGGSAGSASVHYQVLSPLAKGLFRRAIMQSGSAFSPWALARDPVDRAKRLAQALGCEPSLLDDPSALLAWLREVPAAALVDASVRVKTEDEILRGLVLTFVPCVEPAHSGAFLPDDPRALAARGDVQRVPLIMGLTSHEGMFMLPSSLLRAGLMLFADVGEEEGRGQQTPEALKAAAEAAEARLLAKMASDLEPVLPEELLIGGRNLQRTRQLCERVKDFFFDGKQLSEDTLEGFADILTDLHFGLGIMRAAREHARLGVPVYLYEFAFRGRLNFVSLMLAGSKVQGVFHGDDLCYLAAMEQIPLPEKGSREELTAKRLQSMWTDFAKSGNPTPAVNEVVTTTWLPFSESRPNYLWISDVLDLRVGLFKERMEFWENLRNK